jgi:UDP-N-acetylenolpyruvoylglucosamine reductase
MACIDARSAGRVSSLCVWAGWPAPEAASTGVPPISAFRLDEISDRSSSKRSLPLPALARPQTNNAAPPSTLRSVSTRPPGVEPDYPLARLTTIRTGGPAELFSRAGTVAELEDLLVWADAEDLEVGVVGSGSNLLVADAGVRGLVVKLDQELSEIERDGTRIMCGGGARLPAVSAQAARAGLSGIEFGVNIPGTVGGAVRMNANAYGGELARALEWVEVVSAAGVERRLPEQLGFAYRRSGLGPREVVARAAFALHPAPAEEVKRTLAEMRRQRKAAQPSGIKTFGSTFKNPGDRQAGGRSAGQLLEAAGCRGLRVGGASFSAKHANFVENHGDATTADVVALMDEGRRRVLERFGVELEPEVQALGAVAFPSEWGRG